LDERTVAQQRLDPVPLAPARYLRSEVSPRFDAGRKSTPRLLEHGASSEYSPASPPALRVVLGLDRLDAFPQLREQIGRTRLNSSHQIISYAVFCLKKKKKKCETVRKSRTMIENSEPKQYR